MRVGGCLMDGCREVEAPPSDTELAHARHLACD